MQKLTLLKGLPCFKFNKIMLMLSCAMITGNIAIIKNSYAGEFFNPAFLSDNGNEVADLSRFDKGLGQAAGDYRVEVFLNGEYVATQDILFVSTEKDGKIKPGSDDTGLIPCLTTDWFKKYNIDISNAILLNDSCVDFQSTYDKSQARFDFEDQKLYIEIPQASFINNIRGYIPPSEWQDGINALLLNYGFTGSHSKDTKNDERYNNYFLNLDSGVNLGSWQVRNASTWNYTSDRRTDNSQWNNIRTYVQKAIIPLKSQLTIGDSFTENDIFDSVGFRGVKLASDDNMLPDSMRGFAPTVRGVANSNAQVTIRQNGYVIYQSYVSPGAFEIKDLYATSNSGNLDVTVKENNGTITQFTVPYSAVPMLQREGRTKYEVTAGEFRSGSSMQNSPDFWQGTISHGLSEGVTVYGGTQLSDNYRAFSAGAGKNLGEWGAISADITQANSRLPNGEHKQGQSVRFLYAKSLNELGTNFQLMGYRYSTKGYYTLSETSYRQMSGYNIRTQDGAEYKDAEIIDYHNLYYTKQGQYQVNISQQFDGYGSVYITGSHQTYWGTNETDQSLQFGYNGNWEDITYGVNWSQNKSAGLSDKDKRIAFNVSVPLSRWFGSGDAADITGSRNNIYSTYTLTRDDNNKVSQQLGISGTLLEDNNLNYNIQQGYANKGESASGSASVNYQGGYGEAGAGYNYGKNWQQVTYTVRGGVLAHQNGITLSQPLGQTNILVEAPGVKDTSVENETGVFTDWRGYAVIPNATAYRNNRVALDITTLPDNAELDNAVDYVVPVQGAIVKANFKSRIGLKAMVTLLQKNGKAVPFGAIVTDEHTGKANIVGDDGVAFMTGLPETGKLNIVWGNGADSQCTAEYHLTAGSNTPISNISARCL